MQETKSHAFKTEVEIGLLDLLVTFAENIKLLIFWPVVLGLCALGISFVMPPTYQSVAVLQAEQPTASLMATAGVLEPVVVSLGLAKDTTVEEARFKLREQMKITVGRNDKLLTLTVSDRSAQQAQAIANAVIKQTYQESRPKGTARRRLETQLAEARERLKNAQDAASGLLKRLESSGSGVNGGAELARGYAELLGASGAAQTQIGALETQLEGLSEALLVQAPTLPQKASHPKKGLIALGVALAAGLGLMLFVFMRQALRGAAENAGVAGKWTRIRQSLGLE